MSRYTIKVDGSFEYPHDTTEKRNLFLVKNVVSRLNEQDRRIKELENKCIDAFMAGQSDCGVDPSYSSAVAWNKENKVISDE